MENNFQTGQDGAKSGSGIKPFQFTKLFQKSSSLKSLPIPLHLIQRTESSSAPVSPTKENNVAFVDESQGRTRSMSASANVLHQKVGAELSFSRGKGAIKKKEDNDQPESPPPLPPEEDSDSDTEPREDLPPLPEESSRITSKTSKTPNKEKTASTTLSPKSTNNVAAFVKSSSASDLLVTLVQFDTEDKSASLLRMNSMVIATTKPQSPRFAVRSPKTTLRSQAYKRNSASLVFGTTRSRQMVANKTKKAVIKDSSPTDAPSTVEQLSDQQLERKQKKEELQKEVEKTTKILEKLGYLPPTKKRNLTNLKIEECLRDEKLSVAFWCFMRDQYAGENLAFWVEVEEYKQLSTDLKRLQRGEQIWSKYFKSGSDYELNIGDEWKNQLVNNENLDIQAKYLFGVQAVVWGLMKTLFPKFLESEILSQADQEEKDIKATKQMKRSMTLERIAKYQKSFQFMLDEGIEYGVAFGIKRGSCTASDCQCIAYKNDGNVSAGGACATCNHWPGSHRNLGKQKTLLGDIVNDPELIRAKLLEPGLKLVSILCDKTQVEMVEKTSTAIISVFAFYERDVDIIKFALSKEIRATSDPSTLFREDRMSIRILCNYLKLISKNWLKSWLCPLVQTMCKSSLTYDVTSEKPAKRKNSIKRLKKLSQLFVNVLFKSTDIVPDKMVMFCSLVREQIAQTFPGHDSTAVAALVFLRFICPCICSPKAWEIVEAHPPANVIRALLLVAKALQCLSLNTKFDLRDPLMSDMNSFVTVNYPAMRKFLLNLATRAEHRVPSAFQVNKTELLEAQQTIMQSLTNPGSEIAKLAI